MVGKYKVISPQQDYDVQKIKFRHHMRLARFYQATGIFKDAMKQKHPVIYNIADKRWRYHAQECLEALRRQNEIVKNAKDPEKEDG